MSALSEAIRLLRSGDISVAQADFIDAHLCAAHAADIPIGDVSAVMHYIDLQLGHNQVEFGIRAKLEALYAQLENQRGRA